MIHPQTGPNADKSELIGSRGQDTIYSQTLTHSESSFERQIKVGGELEKFRSVRHKIPMTG